MSSWKRFWIGGGGALLPLLVTLLAVDLISIIDHAREYSTGTYVGTGIRYTILFALGGIVAALNYDEVQPIKLLQLGIGAPALIASYVNAQAPKTTPAPAPPPAAHVRGPAGLLNFISPAYGMEVDEYPHRIVIAEGFLSDVFKGATNSLPAIDDKNLKSGVADERLRAERLLAERRALERREIEESALRRAIEDARKSADAAATAASKAADDAARAASQPSFDATSAAKQSASESSVAAQKAHSDVKILEDAADTLTSKSR